MQSEQTMLSTQTYLSASTSSNMKKKCYKQIDQAKQEAGEDYKLYTYV